MDLRVTRQSERTVVETGPGHAHAGSFRDRELAFCVIALRLEAFLFRDGERARHGLALCGRASLAQGRFLYSAGESVLTPHPDLGCRVFVEGAPTLRLALRGESGLLVGVTRAHFDELRLALQVNGGTSTMTVAGSFPVFVPDDEDAGGRSRLATSVVVDAPASHVDGRLASLLLSRP